MKRSAAILLVAILVATLAAMPGMQSPASAAAKDVPAWPGWRGGPMAYGISEDKALPDTWSATQNVQWKIPIPGRGHSSPVVWDKYIFLTTAVEGAEVPGMEAAVLKDFGQDSRHPDSIDGNRTYDLKVMCINRSNGKILWQHTVFTGVPYDFRHKQNTYATPTPVTDGKYVYFYFGPEGMYAYDFKGKQVWKTAIRKFSSAGVGIGNNPVLYKDKVFLQIDFEDGKESFLTAYDKNTGKEVWKKPRQIQLSWVTPVIVETGQRTELITAGNERIIAYDPANGAELWSVTGLKNNAVPTPLQGHGMVYVYSGYPGRKIYAIKTGGSGDVTTTHVAWQADRYTAYVPSGILYGDTTYFITGRGIMTALDAKTGAVKYSNGRVPVPATFTASPIAYDGKIVLISEDGDAFVIKAGEKYEVLRTNSLGEPVYATPAMAAGRLYIRSEKHLWSIGGKKS